MHHQKGGEVPQHSLKNIQVHDANKLSRNSQNLANFVDIDPCDKILEHDGSQV
jgi:hypothetical protein